MMIRRTVISGPLYFGRRHEGPNVARIAPRDERLLEPTTIADPAMPRPQMAPWAVSRPLQQRSYRHAPPNAVASVRLGLAHCSRDLAERVADAAQLQRSRHVLGASYAGRIGPRALAPALAPCVLS